MTEPNGDQIISRLFTASLNVHAAISLTESPAIAARAWRAVGELDAAIADIRRVAIESAATGQAAPEVSATEQLLRQLAVAMVSSQA